MIFASGVVAAAEPAANSENNVSNVNFSYCGKFATIANTCSCGATHAKILLDGKEWCPVCGKDGSKAHMRRLSRVLPKLMQLPTIGYYVIEFPLDCRKVGQGGVNGDPADISGWCRKKSDLRETTNDIVEVFAGKRSPNRRKLNRQGGYYDRGGIRWHWFGDKNPGKYNPHVNVIVEDGYISKCKLESIKEALRQKLNCRKLIVHYSFYDQPGEIYHKGKYITRATFLKKEWDSYMAAEIWNFRNMRWWGKWDSPKLWTIDKNMIENLADLLAVEILQQGKCPRCGERLKWGKPVPALFLAWMGRELAGTGYYVLSSAEMRLNSVFKT